MLNISVSRFTATHFDCEAFHDIKGPVSSLFFKKKTLFKKTKSVNIVSKMFTPPIQFINEI